MQEAPKQKSRQREDDDVVRITTNLVQVDAMVTDSNGKPVTDLKPEEVQIYEDGRLRKITNFSYLADTGGRGGGVAPPSPTTGATPPPFRLRPEDVRRTIALVVDDLGLSFQTIYSTRRALKKFVDEQMRPGDMVAIIRTSGGVGTLQQFTSDRRQLYAAIEALKWYGTGRSGPTPFEPTDPPTPGAKGAEVDAQKAEMEGFREDLSTVGTLGAISHVVRGLRDLPGRKTVVVISDGIRINDDGDRARDTRAGRALQRLIDQAARASVVIHTFNASGLQRVSPSAADSLADSSTVSGARTPDGPRGTVQLVSDRGAAINARQAGLTLLAEKTGGTAVRNSNDLSAGIRRLLDDAGGYYLIGYQPDASTFDAGTGRRLFHKLSLRVTRQGKYSVRMRDGFFGVADEEASPSPRTPQGQITNALLSPFGASGIRVQLTSLFANDAANGSFMRSFLYVDANDLTFTEEADGWRTATFDVVAVTFDEGGNVVDQMSRTDALRVRGEGYQQVLKHGFVYFVVLPIKKSGAYQLRAVLRDHNSERIGSASQFVEIPDLKKGRLALSGLMLSTKEEAGRQPDPQAGEAVRHFKSGMVMRYSFVIYNARLDKDSRSPQLQVQVQLFRGGQPVFTGKVQSFPLNNPPDLGRLAASGAVTLGTNMVPGEYVLQVTVNDLLADEKRRTVSQWIDFEVMK
ncbi:MAG TPA: VWA domain-containing protein [Pyrinomonadaceae bacterium]|jgi:VWFA-related protein